MVTTIRLTHTYLFCVFGLISTFSKFQVYVQPTIINYKHCAVPRSPELIHFITEGLSPLTSIYHPSDLPTHPPAPDNHHCTLYFYEFYFF